VRSLSPTAMMRVKDAGWSDTFLGQLVIKLMSYPSVDKAKTDRILAFRKEHDTHEFLVTINSVDFDFQNFVDEVEKTLEQDAVDRVAKLMEGRISELMNNLNDVTSDIVEAMRKEVRVRLGRDQNDWRTAAIDALLEANSASDQRAMNIITAHRDEDHEP